MERNGKRAPTLFFKFKETFPSLLQNKVKNLCSVPECKNPHVNIRSKMLFLTIGAEELTFENEVPLKMQLESYLN